MRVPVTWAPREVPLAALGLVAWGSVAEALRHRLLRAPDEALEGWAGVSVPGGLALRGEALPWVDGVRYVGAEVGASGLWMPTTRRPSVPAALLERAVLARCPEGSSPVIVVDERIVPLGGARPLDRGLLERWRP